ncbi:NUDIX hydrolase [Pseudopedobacter saltans DSM 12145]|uniref:NUDIX hydrolase n=2 Tax=Pseudopedobacter saltans TaxID=151895 RepID=F0SED6_PSESL|nr:NUDIX hydrolase [Pseudopedobacter saltans DSM 12145]
MQNYNIYINEKALIITSVVNNQVEKAQIIDGQHFDLSKFYDEILERKEDHFYILSDNPEETFNELTKTVKIIEAAGGLVESAKETFLFIKRLGKWDLPKGKLEEDEVIEETAVREVEEECGVVVNKLNQKITDTYHMYKMKDQVILKITYWYSMSVDEETELTPQTEEDITEARWLGKSEWSMVFENTYPSILEVLKKSGATN